jgi:DNA-binding FadR family transcriptional regulator
MEPSSGESQAGQVADVLRGQLYAAETPYPPGAMLPSEADLAREHGHSRSLIGTALEILAREDLVSVQPGRGTFVLPRRLYRAVAEVPRTGQRDRDEVRRLGEAARPALDAEPAVRTFRIETDQGQAQFSLTVECGSVGRAAAIVYVVARAAGRDGGWDLGGAEIAAGPADDLA